MSLLAAAKRETVVEIQQALDDGADINERDDDGKTSLVHAVERGNREIVELLLKKDNISLNVKGNYDRTPLCHAAKKGHREIVELLLEKDGISLNAKDEHDRTPLCYAAQEGHREIVELLLKKDGISLNVKDKYDKTPLCHAAEKGHREIVELLLEKDGINLNVKGNFGRTPLCYAAENGHREIVELLLEKDGINLNLEDKYGKTPLSYAARNGHQEVLRLLLENDSISLSPKDNKGQTPLFLAAKHGNLELAKLLLEKVGIDWDSKMVVRPQVKKKDIILHTMVREGKESLVQLLIEAKYDVNSTDLLGKTPLHIAISSQNAKIANLLISFNETDMNLKDNEGITPLYLAIQIGCPDLIERLLEKSALVKGIMADEWRKAYGKGASATVMLSERESGKKFVRFIAEEEVLDHLAQISIEGGTDKRLFLISENWIWQKMLIPPHIAQLAPYRLEISFQRYDGVKGERISVAIRFPTEQDLEFRKVSKMRDWDTCRISWIMAPPLNPGGDQYWKSLDYFSMMPFGWIPDNGVGFFKQFIIHLKERWLRHCDLAKDHLDTRRLDQLSSEGKNPELIRYLASDAQRWATFRSSLQDQVREARNFIVEYSQRYNENQSPKDVQHEIGEFESQVNERINELDQTVRDLLQIEFAWVSMSETRISTKLGQNVMLLTYISIFYMPLAFCAAIWAIPNIADSATRNPFVITAIIIGILTFLVAFNLEIIMGLYFDQRANLVQEMQKDGSWKELGNKLHGSSPNRRTPSDWWLVVYMLQRSIKRVVGRKGRKDDMESVPNGGES